SFQTRGVAMDISPDGKRIAASSSDKIVKVWDLETDQAMTPSLQHDAPVCALRFSPDGKRLATLSGYMATGSAGQPLNNLTLNKLLSTPHVSSASLHLWDLVTGQKIGSPLPGIVRFAFSPEGKTLATASEDGILRVWNVATGLAVGPPLTLGGP